MKKQGLFALVLSLMLALSACGTPSSNTPSKSDSGDKSSISIPDNTPSKDSSNSKSNVTADFLKTITAETAEAKGVCGADLTWYYQDGVLVIKGTGEMTNFYYSYDETNMPWVDYQDKIGWVIIQEGVTSIGAYSFAKCVALTKIELPETIETIGSGAFERCNRLPNIKLPDSLTYIGEKTFNLCTKFEDIVIPKSVTYIGEGAFWDTTLKSLTFLGDAPEIPPTSLGETVTLGEPETIYYCGSGFDEWVANYPNVNWVKQ